MSRTTRWRFGLTAVAAFLMATAVLPAPGHAEDVTDYAITIDPTASGAAISNTMYGVFFEDINRAADGGLYAELVQNRSFEYSTDDHASYTPLTSWTVSGTAQVANDAGRLNERNRTYLLVDAGAAVSNEGYNTGIAVEQGKRYDFSVWARAEHGSTLHVTLQDGAGALATARDVGVQKAGWAKYTATFTATRTSTTGRLTLASPGAAALDMVSLFPHDTYRNEPNGLRKDLAEKIAALRPGFVRFPGGCLVNTGSMEDYSESSNWQRKRSYQWKDTIGPVEQRATNANFWGYNQSYGLGYYELLRFAEDIGAMPLPVVPALVTGCGQNQAVDDEALLKRHIQDTLDLIEFANGPATPPWGRRRAAMGHPQPFHLTHIEVGNEENLPNEFFARLQRFRTAIEAAYPDVTVISNSGPDDGQEWGSFTDDKPAEPFRQVVTRDARTGELIVKVVNDQSSAARTAIDLGGARTADRAKVTTLAAAPDAVNTEASTPVTARTSTFTGVADTFTYTFPANSVTFLRIRQR